MGFQFQSVASVSPQLVDQLSISYAEVGTLIGLFMLPGVVIALPSGVLGARFGDKRACVFGLALMVVGGLLMGVGQSYAAVFAGRLITGIGAVLFNVILTKMVADWFAGKEIVTAMGVILSSWPVGIALGLVVQSALAAVYSWPTVMYLSSGACALAFALVIALYRSRPTTENVSEPSRVRFKLPMRELAPVSIAGLAWGSFNVGLVIFFSFTPGLLVGRGMSSTDAGTLVSVGLWVSLISLPLGGYLTERVGRPKSTIMVFCLLAAGALFLLPYVPIPLVLSILVGLAIRPPAGAIMALPTQVLSAESRGTGLGVFYAWYYAAMAAGPALAGMGRDLTASQVTPVLIGGGMFVGAVLSVAVFSMLKTDRKPRSVSTV
jgi:predicted MFS family arabinose efflux permease